MMGSRTSWGGVSVRVLVTELNHKDLGSVLYWYISQSPMSPCVYGEDKRGQEWTRGDKRGQKRTRVDKRGQERTRGDKRGQEGTRGDKSGQERTRGREEERTRGREDERKRG